MKNHVYFQAVLETRDGKCEDRDDLRVDRPGHEEDLQEDVLHHARHRDPPDRGPRGRARDHGQRLLLDQLPQGGEAIQGQVQAGQSYSGSYRGETLPLPLPWLWQDICEIRKSKNT